MNEFYSTKLTVRRGFCDLAITPSKISGALKSNKNPATSWWIDKIEKNDKGTFAAKSEKLQEKTFGKKSLVYLFFPFL